MNTRALVAEFIGTFAIIFIVAGADALGTGGLVGVAFAYGLTVLTFAYAYSHISGAHFNPAITLGLWVGKQIDTASAVAYIVVQIIGGIVGGYVLLFLLGSESTLGATVLADGVTPLQGFVLEAILTFFLVNVVYNTAVSGKAGNFAPIAIGLTLTLSILMGGTLTGASLNPARTIGPAVASLNFAYIWVYILAHVVGGVVAALLYTNLLKPES